MGLSSVLTARALGRRQFCWRAAGGRKAKVMPTDTGSRHTNSLLFLLPLSMSAQMQTACLELPSWHR